MCISGFDLPHVPHGAESRGAFNVPHPGNLDFPTPPVSNSYFPSVPAPTPAPTPIPTPTPQSTPQPFINNMPYNSVINDIGDITSNNGMYDFTIRLKEFRIMYYTKY